MRIYREEQISHADLMGMFAKMAKTVKFIEVDGSIYVRNQAGSLVSPLVALARFNGFTAFDNIEAASKLNCSMRTANTVILACEKARGYSASVRKTFANWVDILDGIDLSMFDE